MEKNKQPSSRRYPAELKERAVRMVLQLQSEDPNDHGVIARVSRQLNVGSQSLRTWLLQSQVDAGEKPGIKTEDHEELTALRREVKELRRSNEILSSAATFFGAELDRRSKT